ncbi:MAG: hypothetical protein HWE39_08945 [Oceanospirillaceae bacterium]|nr:hypothetical protein [Oceanospirillaceae bacterium]
MKLEGQAVLALWNDTAVELDEEYNAWHSTEHVPERLTVPGIVRARRYKNADDATYPYFTLYELLDLDVLESAPYRTLIEHPTPWSRRMRTKFTNMKRVPASNRVSQGEPVGERIVTLMCELDAGVSEEELVSYLTATEGVCATHLGKASVETGSIAWRDCAETENEAYVLLVELESGFEKDKECLVVEDRLTKFGAAKNIIVQCYKLLEILNEIK